MNEVSWHNSSDDFQYDIFKGYGNPIPEELMKKKFIFIIVIAILVGGIIGYIIPKKPTKYMRPDEIQNQLEKCRKGGWGVRDITFGLTNQVVEMYCIPNRSQ